MLCVNHWYLRLPSFFSVHPTQGKKWPLDSYPRAINFRWLIFFKLPSKLLLLNNYKVFKQWTISITCNREGLYLSQNPTNCHPPSISWEVVTLQNDAFGGYISLLLGSNQSLFATCPLRSYRSLNYCFWGLASLNS